MSSIRAKLIEIGVRASDSKMYEEDKVWSRFSHDKVDIGEELAKIIRTLNKGIPLFKAMKAVSVGSSAEPQFRILETVFRGGLYLLDIDNEALDVVRERVRRQRTTHVAAICGDYKRIFSEAGSARAFLRDKLGGKKAELITLHHSLYYCGELDWEGIFGNLYRILIAPVGAMHAVLMASKSDDQYTTTWLYNHFADKFFACRNEQDLYKLRRKLKENPVFERAQILMKTHRVFFNVADFKKFMVVIWMILLYPNVHKYSFKQKEEITEFIYRKFWTNKKPLAQLQDHMVIYKGIGFKGLA